MTKAEIYLSTLIVFVIGASLFFPIGQAFGHGLGFDTISSIDVDGKKIAVTVEMPTFFEESNKLITINAIDEKTKENVNNVTFLIGLFHGNELIFRNYFFTPDGNLIINIEPTEEYEIQILGEQDSLLGAWHATDSQPLVITGPLFKSGGLYHFEIEIRTIDEPTNIVENLGIYTADVSVVDTTTHLKKDLQGDDVKFRMKSYFDKISNFEYNAEEKIVTFEIPFDWSEKTISHIPVVHEEVHFPKDFTEFLSPSYIGKVNDVKLFKSSVTVDDYTEEDERIVHFVLLADHLKFLKNEQKKSSDELPQKMIFTLASSDAVEFPMIAMTKNEEIQVDLSWDPIKIEPGKQTKFIFTIRDSSTGEPIRQSTYGFVIIQNGKEVYKNAGTATVGGAFEEFTFSESQTGPTIIRLENIRDSGLETEFSVMVVPEFGFYSIMILAGAITTMVIINRSSLFQKRLS